MSQGLLGDTMESAHEAISRTKEEQAMSIRYHELAEISKQKHGRWYLCVYSSSFLSIIYIELIFLFE